MLRPFRCILLALFFFAVPCFASAYPIPPQPLRKLCTESEFIVVAIVGGSLPIEGDDGLSAKVRLQILSPLKGDLNEPVIEVLYSPNMICPAPPESEYPQGGQVIAFT
jgi:hypothetical protein